MRLHMRYCSRDTHNLLERLADCYLMQFGHSRRILNVISGRTEDRSVFIFDYHYETGSAQDRILHRHSVVVWQLKDTLPAAAALTEKPFLPIGTFRHFTPMQTGDPKFDGWFHLYTDDWQAVEKRLTPDVRKFLLLCGKVNWQWQGQFMVFDTERILSALQIARLIHRGSHCCRLIADAKNIDAPVPPESTPAN